MSDMVERLNAALGGRYAIERELGEGGMATVSLADDIKHERKVALKVLKSELAAVVGAERFLAEIKTTANLQHPHILPLFDSGEADGFLFYVMPFEGGVQAGDAVGHGGQDASEACRAASGLRGWSPSLRSCPPQRGPPPSRKKAVSHGPTRRPVYNTVRP